MSLTHGEKAVLLASGEMTMVLESSDSMERAPDHLPPHQDQAAKQGYRGTRTACTFSRRCK